MVRRRRAGIRARESRTDARSYNVRMILGRTTLIKGSWV